MATTRRAVQRGIERGRKLALNPTMENYRQLRTRRRTIELDPWSMVGKALADSMETESKRLSGGRAYQRKESSR